MQIVSIVALVLLTTSAYADETVVEKAKTAADTATRNTKQTVRKEKKKLRKKTGHQDRVKDVKDSAQNVGEDVSDEAKKVKRKID